MFQFQDPRPAMPRAMTGDVVDVISEGGFSHPARVTQSARRSQDGSTVWVAPIEREMTHAQLVQLLQQQRNAIDWFDYDDVGVLREVAGGKTKTLGAPLVALRALLGVMVEHDLIDWTQFDDDTLGDVVAGLITLPTREEKLTLRQAVPPPPPPSEFVYAPQQGQAPPNFFGGGGGGGAFPPQQQQQQAQPFAWMPDRT